MRVRFLGAVSIPGGPRYLRGEVIETDARQFSDAYAARLIARGWAEVVPDPVPLAEKAPGAPPIDRMVRKPWMRK